jgi:EAL domain-containing protein (putative c-di-GMP-specific phosphodiesterase class I)
MHGEPRPGNEMHAAVVPDPETMAEFGSPLDAAVAFRDREVLALVRNAIDRRRVVLAFQPVVQAAQPDRVAFHEGLIRILDGHGRAIPARHFIAAVEAHETGRLIDCLSLDLGLTALRRHPGLRLSVNASARSMGYRRWRDTLRRGLHADPSVGERLILEIGEASAMLMPDIVASFMYDLQRTGIAFALDDFGAGLTSFRHLREFLFDIVKIDGQISGGVHTSPDNQVLTAALVAVAEHFEMFTVAGSVENGDDARHLADMGVDCLQGYHFGAPTLSPPWADLPPAAVPA